MKIFFDSSVLVAAFTFPGVCANLLARSVAAHSIYVSEYVIEEVVRTLRNKFHAAEPEIEDRIGWLRDHAVVILSYPQLDIALRDPTDIPIVSAAVAGVTDVLVSGDKDLLELINPPLRILSPRALLEMIVNG